MKKILLTSLLLILGIISISNVHSQTYAPIPYSTGFESGTLDANWSTPGQAGTRAQIWTSGTLTWSTQTANAHTGTRMFGMDASPGGSFVTAEAWMRLDLGGASSVVLDFWWSEWNDENHVQDGVFFSDNGGTSFTKVLDLPGASYTDLSWNHFTLNVDSICNVHGLNRTSTFVVKFQQHDNYYFAGGNDGHFYDDISVTGITCSNPPVIACLPNDTLAADSNSCGRVWSWTAPSAQSQCAASPLKITECNPNSPDMIEIQNTGAAQDFSGYFVAISDDYTNISISNSIVWNLGNMTAGQILYKDDNTGPNYWGNNMFWNSTSNSWAMIINSADSTVVDAVFWGWNSTAINNFSATINGIPVTIPTSVWSGNGLPTSCSGSYNRTGTTDNDNASDWICATSASPGVQNSGYNPTAPAPPAGIAVVQVAGPANGSAIPIGMHTITYVATDSGNGLSDTCSFTLLVEDQTAPMAVCQNTTVQLTAGGTVSLNTNMVDGGSSDNCSISGMTLSDTLLTCADLGANTVTLTVVDSVGNSSFCTATVTVEDTAGLAAQPVSLGPDQNLCDSTTVTLDAGPGFASYLWSTGDTTQTITASTSGNYSVTVTNGLGCEGSDDATLSFGSIVPTITQTGDTLCASGAVSYQWYLNGNPITGATSQCIEFSAGGGTYYVQTVDSFGCTNNSDTTVIVSIGAGNPAAIRTEVWPNPFRDAANISFTLPVTAQVQVEIFDLTGQRVTTLLNEEVFAGASRTVVFRPENQSAGVYLWRISTDQGHQLSGRLILQQ